MAARETIELLFEQIKEETARDASGQEIELELAQLHQFTQVEHEKIAVLFDLALEQVVDPEHKDRYLNLSQLSERRVTESSALTTALQRFERIVQAPFGAKKASTAAADTSYRQPLYRAAVRVVPAQPRDRLSALLIDLLCAGLISAIAIVPLSPLTDTSPLHDIGLKNVPKIYEYISLSVLYLKILLIVLMIYPAAMLMTRGHTIGLSLRRIKLSSDNGAPPKTRQILVRVLLTPLSLLTLAPIAVMQRRKSLSDLLSRTTICRI